MQYKRILCALLFGCAVVSVSDTSAQQKPNYWQSQLPGNRSAAAAEAKKKEKEVLDAARARELFCKEEDARSVIACQLASTHDERMKAMVPLAGQKSYFGPMNDYVMDFVRQYLATHNKTLNVVSSRSKTQFSMMDNVLKKNNLPNQLKYLAVIESALNNKAISPVGAVGPWQFMESTARMMGLTVNTKRDDRTDWFKSTTAAARYLNYLYSDLQDWLLVIAAYNSGPTPVQRAIEKTGSRNFWEIKKYLPRETQGHVLAFIATASIFENMQKFITFGKIPEDFVMHPEMEITKSGPVRPKPKVNFTEDELKNMAIIIFKDPMSIDILAQDLQIEKRILERWNPDYELFVLDLYPEKEYRFRIPKDKVDGYLEKKASLEKKSDKYFKENML
jgi:membrane-bound lytic murein transglycosylase D